MAVTDHGNFDLTLEVTEELLTTALLAQVQAPTIPSTSVATSQFTVRPELTASVIRADCRSGGAATVALLGSVTGNLVVESINLPYPLPTDPEKRKIKIESTFAVVTNPRVGTVAGTRGLVFPAATAVVEVTLDEGAVTQSYLVNEMLTFAYIIGGQEASDRLKVEILTLITGALRDRLRQAVAGLGDFLALPEPSGMSFRVVLTTNPALKLLATVVAPDGDPALVSGLTVRRNSSGGPRDQCVFAVSNVHLLGSVVFPALTSSLGISGTPSRPEHPCLLLGGPPLPGATFGIPTLPGGVPAATVTPSILLGQIDGSGIRVDLILRAVSFGGFATITMNGTLTAPISATVAGGTLTIGLGAFSVATSSSVAIAPSVFLAGILTGGAVFSAVNALVSSLAGPFIDSFIRTSVIPGITGTASPTMSIPLPGAFTALTVNEVQTTEVATPARSVVIGGITIPLDRVNDVFVRLV